jgi:hypothetical protein
LFGSGEDIAGWLLSAQSRLRLQAVFRRRTDRHFASHRAAAAAAAVAAAASAAASAAAAAAAAAAAGHFIHQEFSVYKFKTND